MSSSGISSMELVDGGRKSAMYVSSKLMIAALAFFFFVVIFVFLLDLYARLRWGPGSATSRRGRRRRLVFGADRDDASAPRRGLALGVLKALPIRIYRSSEFEEATDCAVCLSELVDGEEVRLLPRCQHGFHVECIDMWFHSHSTCPLCRNPVGAAGVSAAAPPADVLRDACEARDRSNTDGAITPATPIANERALVIEIPRRAADAFTSPVSSSLPSSRRVEDVKSPAAAAATPSRLMSLRKIMSREKRVVVASCCSSPCGGGGSGDLEMGVTGPLAAGGVGSGGAKTPHKIL